MDTLSRLIAGDQLLWARIARHDFDHDHVLSFSMRLAREQGWTAAFARGAILEYRRFCYLAVTAGKPMTPSEEVDAVWHLHLTYTRDYWDVWCKEVLQTQLHHDPTEGGTRAQQRFREQYASTLLEYERAFGPPPAEYWPATHLRFRLGSRFSLKNLWRRG